jgi:hypothetical protein
VFENREVLRKIHWPKRGVYKDAKGRIFVSVCLIDSYLSDEIKENAVG